MTQSPPALFADLSARMVNGRVVQTTVNVMTEDLTMTYWGFVGKRTNGYRITVVLECDDMSAVDSMVEKT